MNEFILCAMDKRKTEKELLENSCAAYAANSAAAAAADAIATNSAAAYAAYAAADLEYYLSEYFTITGESREEYQKEADK